MNRREMLEKLGLTEEELQDLMKKFVAFVESLNEHQRKVVRRNLPSIEESARSFGPGVSVEELKRFVGPGVTATSMGCWEIGDDEEL